MPELPEVEVVCKSLEKYLIGRYFESIFSFTEKLRYPVEIHKKENLLKSKVCTIRRYGRYIVIELENLSALIIHLGMSGKLRCVSTDNSRQKHEHIIFNMDNKLQLRYESTRKFGYIKSCVLTEKEARPDYLSELGYEPLSEDFNTEYLHGICKKRKTAIKNIIMDNKIVAGLGNIYATESLFNAGVNPFTSAQQLPLNDIEQLISEIKTTLQQAIKTGIEFNKNKTTLDGEEWHFPTHAKIYGKTGENCCRCRTTIKATKQSGRTSFFCPNCQSKK